MNKKQLLAENSRLFAVAERQNTELEAIKLRFEEQSVSFNKIVEENSALKEEKGLLSNTIISLNKEIEELKKNLAEISATSLTYENIPDAVPPQPEEVSLKDEDRNFKKIDSDIEEAISNITKYDTVEPVADSSSPRITGEQREGLKKHGAAAIGAVTKVVAYVLGELQSGSNENTEGLYSLALGKNENFKMKVLSLIESEGNFDKICSELDEMTKNTVQSISELLN